MWLGGSWLHVYISRPEMLCRKHRKHGEHQRPHPPSNLVHHALLGTLLQAVCCYEHSQRAIDYVESLRRPPSPRCRRRSQHYEAVDSCRTDCELDTVATKGMSLAASSQQQRRTAGTCKSLTPNYSASKPAFASTCMPPGLYMVVVHSHLQYVLRLSAL